MSGFDEPGIYYSDSFGVDTSADEGQVRKSQLQRRFKEFLRQYRVGTDRTGFTFKYRCCGVCGNAGLLFLQGIESSLQGGQRHIGTAVPGLMAHLTAFGVEGLLVSP